MVTGWDLGWYPGGVDVFLTHWTVGSGDPLHTLVSSLQMIGQAHVTSVTVEIVATSTNPAYATARTVKLLLVLIIIQLAIKAKVFPKQCSTIAAILLHWLSMTTNTALNLNNIISSKCMILFFIMTKSTAVQAISTTWSHKLTFSSVMFTSIVINLIISFCFFCHFDVFIYSFNFFTHFC